MAYRQRKCRRCNARRLLSTEFNRSGNTIEYTVGYAYGWAIGKKAHSQKFMQKMLCSFFNFKSFIDSFWNNTQTINVIRTGTLHNLLQNLVKRKHGRI